MKRPDDAQYAAALTLLRKVTTLVRARQAAYRRQDEATKRAIQANSYASQRVNDGIRVARALLEALTDSAGVSKAVPLDEAMADARTLIADALAELDE